MVGVGRVAPRWAFGACGLVLLVSAGLALRSWGAGEVSLNYDEPATLQEVRGTTPEVLRDYATLAYIGQRDPAVLQQVYRDVHLTYPAYYAVARLVVGDSPDWEHASRLRL